MYILQFDEKIYIYIFIMFQKGISESSRNQMISIIITALITVGAMITFCILVAKKQRDQKNRGLYGGGVVYRGLTKEEQIEMRLRVLGYKCKYCQASLQNEVCEFCGRTNFKIK